MEDKLGREILKEVIKVGERLDGVEKGVRELKSELHDVLDIVVYIKDNAVTREEFEEEINGEHLYRRIPNKQKVLTK